MYTRLLSLDYVFFFFNINIDEKYISRGQNLKIDLRFYIYYSINLPVYFLLKQRHYN